jgi:hypothetical protein
MSPKTAWIGEGWLPRMPDSLDQLDGLLLTVPKNRIVQRDGIHFKASATSPRPWHRSSGTASPSIRPA